MDLFGTAGVRGNVATRVTPDLAVEVGRAVGLEAAETGGGSFVVGRDGRTTGRGLLAAVEAGLESAGADVRVAGMLPTPALAFASRTRRGVMVTASHNPPSDNGIKLFRDGVEYDAEREAAVEQFVESETTPVPWDQWGERESVHPLSAYRRAVTEYAASHGATPEDATVVVDCGNGVASLATPQVLRRLGARVVTLNGNVDGHFPGRESKPTPSSLTDLRQFVGDGDAAFGIAHDGDADRIVVVDDEGAVVHEDTVLAILAEHYVVHADADDPVVVTTPNASARIDERVRAAGGRVERVRLGALHEGIADATATGGDVVFAAEPWKHVHPAFGGWIDGVVSAALITRLVADSGLDALRAPVTERPYRKLSVDCPDEAKSAVMQALGTSLPDAFPEATVDTEYGLRLEFPDASWLLVRPSGTEPYVRVYAESDDVDALVEHAIELVGDVVADA
ncbi:MAG: phosphopentomutase/phosphoglucosamine mutase [Halobacteriota archaeon]